MKGCSQPDVFENVYRQVSCEFLNNLVYANSRKRSRLFVLKVSREVSMSFAFENLNKYAGKVCNS